MFLQKFPGGLPARLMFSTAIWRGYCAVAATQTLSSTRSDDGLQMQLSQIGPPELYHSLPITANNQDDVSSGDRFMDSMLSSFNRYREPVMGRTENDSPTYMSSGNPCLDFFFHVVPDTPPDQVASCLKSAWDQDPCTALKLVYNLRGVRGTGKSDREGFYNSALWLQENHPKTLAGNVRLVPEFGYYKDLLEILYRLVEGSTVREDEKALLKRRRGIGGNKWWVGRGGAFLEEEGKPLMSRKQKRLAAMEKGKDKYNNDPTYRFLHDHVSELFAEHLRSDLEKLRLEKYNDLSLASKWCPSLYRRFDNSTLLCESIARRLFPKDQCPEYEGIEDAHYAYRVRDRLRKEVLVPLRIALKLPEVFMSASEWDFVDYTRVASVAMRNYTELFRKHDGEQFSEYLLSVKKGRKKIAAGALLPHQIVKNVEFDDDEVAELQWRRIIEDMSTIGELKNCLAICDVSGSMCGWPLDVSVALGLLVSELSEQPWKGKLITFSEYPMLQVIQGENLRYKICSIKQLHWDTNTDFQRVFDKILEVALDGNLTEDQMIKRLFVFSDMEFDEASANDWETDYQAIVRKFSESGFSRVPEIVFWNLRNSRATPVASHQKGVALVSGFSKNLLKLFLKGGGVLDPVKTMETAISGKEYEELVVLD